MNLMAINSKQKISVVVLLLVHAAMMVSGEQRKDLNAKVLYLTINKLISRNFNN